MFDLSTRDVKYLPGVGPQRAAILNKELNIYSLRDLLYYFPYKYVDRSRLYYIHEIDGNMPYIQLKGEILSFETFGEGRQRRLVGHFSDGTGVIDLVWFQGIKYLLEHYKTRTEYIVFGKPTVFNGRINVAHPDMDPSGELTLSAMGLQPYYNTTERMKRGFLNSHGLEKLMKNALALLQEPLAETLSPQIIEEHHLMSLDDAIRNIHFPQNPELLRKAQYRLKFEELFYVQLNILRYSKDRQRKYRGLYFDKVGEIFNTFYSQNLPFELTGAQKRVIKEIRKDMGSGRQMNRLLQGDVGSGKTIVAFMSMLLALDNGFQACLMAPTEILANQHFIGLSEFATTLNINIKILTGSTKTAARKIIHEELENGSLQILIGTHALLEDKVQFQNLGLAVIDEQHRFGVEQRSKLWMKGSLPQSFQRKEANSILKKYQTARPSTYALLKDLKNKNKGQSTQAEAILWECLRNKNLNHKFRRQHIIDMFIADFICLEKNLIIEVDGGYHNASEQKEADELRTQILNEIGFKVIRFTNEEIITNIDQVIHKINTILKSLPSGEVGGAPIPPHVLVMTATPIPRTLAMSLYGDLDVSVIDELPPGRKPIQTVHRFDSNRLKVWKFIRDEIALGRQIYIVYPLIQESEKMDFKDLMDGYESISRDFPLPDYSISILHGKMKPAEKDAEMKRFAEGKTNIMVATTVIEVGVNVPNASVMIIESAERFGLSQLHQLRGRVGRGADQSYCILMTSYKLTSDSKIRMETMVNSNDGFEIAEVDLKLRGPGDIMGTQQSGVLNLQIADLVKDKDILLLARNYAFKVLNDDPSMQKPENNILRMVFMELTKKKNIWNYIS